MVWWTRIQGGALEQGDPLPTATCRSFHRAMAKALQARAASQLKPMT